MVDLIGIFFMCGAQCATARVAADLEPRRRVLWLWISDRRAWRPRSAAVRMRDAPRHECATPHYAYSVDTNSRSVERSRGPLWGRMRGVSYSKFVFIKILFF